MATDDCQPLMPSYSSTNRIRRIDVATPNSAPLGKPRWCDLWTSDVEGSRRFYPQLFGWEALEPDPRYGGYFNFARHGAWTAGCMGPMGDMKANDTWKPYFNTDNIEATLEQAEAAGANVQSGAMPVGDLGLQAVVTDPYGAVFGLWQPGAFAGFSVIGQPGAPSWFELHTREHAGSVAFYREVLGHEIDPVSDTDEFRYSTFRSPGSPEGFRRHRRLPPLASRRCRLLGDLLACGRHQCRCGRGKVAGWRAEPGSRRHPLWDTDDRGGPGWGRVQTARQLLRERLESREMDPRSAGPARISQDGA
jgi:predicted enzyme related to lactoylglutathione lyase